jgi:subtilisin-like proprotein convertase family protein
MKSLSRITLVLFIAAASAFQCAANTYTVGPGLAVGIPDNAYNGTLATMASVPISVPDSATIADLNVTVAMRHTWVGDLTIKLVSPTGTVVTLVSRPGQAEAADNGADPPFGEPSNLIIASPITYDDSAANSAEDMGTTPTDLDTNGVNCQTDLICTRAPDPGAAVAGNLTTFNGQDTSGTWTLYIGDGGQGDTGSIDTVTLTFTNAVVVATECTPPPPNMVAWWRGDGNADDSIGGHNGTVFGGVAFGSGEVAQAFNFAGTSGRVLVPSSPSLNPSSQITIDAWVRSTGTGFQGLVGKSRPAADAAYDLGIADATHVVWRIPGVSPFGLLQVSAPIADGQWHHLAATYDGATMAVYFDGQLAGSSSNNGAIPSSSVPLVLGAFLQSDGTYGFSLDGQLDEVEIFDRALSAQEIADIHAAGSFGKCKCTPPPDGMVSWWPLEGSASDIQGDNDGTITGGVSSASGEVGGGFDLDGATGFVNFGNPASLQLTSAITVDAWVRPDTTQGNYRTVVTKWSQNSSNSSWGLFIADNILYGYVTASGGTVVAAGGSVPFGASAPFSHVAMTYSNADGLRVYLNGVQVGSDAGNGDINNGGENVQIGNDTDFVPDRWFDGVIDEVEIFSRVLSVDEIAAIHDAGSAGKCRPCTPAPSGMTDWWPGDGNANNIQGFHEGTLHGNTSFTPGKVGQAFRFDGIGDYVDVGDVDLPGTFTIDAWINHSLPTIVAMPIVAKFGTFLSYSLSVINDGALQGSVSNGLQQVLYKTAPGTIVTGGWQHVAMTYDVNAPAGARILLYVNGANVAASPDVDDAVAPGDEASSALIGSDGGVDGFDGLIDEVELFNRVLSPSEVSGIYDAGSGGKCKPAVPAARHLVNISSRASVGTGDNVAIGGFIIQDDPVGPRPSSTGLLKPVLIRGLGPSLNVNGIPVVGRLADTVLELHDSGGGLMTSNDDWGDAPNASDVTATGLAPADSHESAILITLQSASTYTAILRGANDTTGIGLIEVYDLEPTGDSHLANISTRGQVLTGDDVLIGGVIVQGGTPVRVMVRGLGPSLNVSGTPVPGRLADPILELHDGNGGLIASNDNWGSSPDFAAITATGLGPPDANESAILFVPAPGVYTAIVKGVGGNGIGLVEAYRLGPP